MDKSKIPSTLRPRLLNTQLPIPKLSTRVLQPTQQNKAHEDPVKQLPTRHMLSRRSKSFSDLRPNLKPIEFPSRKPVVGSSSASKVPPMKPLMKSTSSSNLCNSNVRRPLIESSLKAIPEIPKTAATKPPVAGVRSTVKRTAATAEDCSKPKISKPAKIAPYDYKARYNLLNEKHTTLIQVHKETKQKLSDNEKDLQDYVVLQSDHLKLQEQFATVSETKSRLAVENTKLHEDEIELRKNLADLTCAHNLLQQDLEALRFKNVQNLSHINELQATRDKLQSEHQTLKSEHKILQDQHSSLQKDHDELKQEHCCLTKITHELEQDLVEARESIQTLQNELYDYKTSLQSHEELRRMMHNQIQDLKGTIRVFCRVRPNKPQEQDKMLCNISCTDESTLEIKKSKESINCISGKASDLKQEFIFDKVFPPEASQAEVFEELSQLVQSALDGYHICVFAYGQTGSGKTYTMQGEDDDRCAGMIPRTVQLIFKLIANLQKNGWAYKVNVSFLEIYNEVVRDLLDPTNKEQHDIRYNEGKGTTVSNLTIREVKSAAELQQLMVTANMNRAIAATNFNEHSSRSHAVTKITLTGLNEEMGVSYVGSLSLVDLAGSESAKTSSAERITETKNINKSLSTLGTVMSALHNKESHIPYRNSKLTYLLQSCLGGNSKTLMFVNIAPFEECFGESVNALRFAAKVKEVKIGSRRNKTYLQRELSNVSK